MSENGNGTNTQSEETCILHKQVTQNREIFITKNSLPKWLITLVCWQLLSPVLPIRYGCLQFFILMTIINMPMWWSFDTRQKNNSIWKESGVINSNNDNTSWKWSHKHFFVNFRTDKFSKLIAEVILDIGSAEESGKFSRIMCVT